MPGPYSGPSGVTTAAPDNPIARADIDVFENAVVDYSPAPGVGPGFGDFTTGFAPLGDLYSPLNAPNTSNFNNGMISSFDRTQAPATNTKPSSFHAGSGTSTEFNGDVNDLNDTYGFIGIDAPGSITLGFEDGIRNGDGADFAVFENAFGFGGPTSLFAELAFVEVSSNGSDFARFDAISLNTAPTATAGSFQGYEVTNIYNLAGKHATNWGTPFDLQELTTHTLVTGGLLDLEDVQYVRLVDVVGSGQLEFGGETVVGATDSLGNPILDSWVTFDSGGFDYLGLPTGSVGVINAVPEPVAILPALLAFASLGRRR